MCVGSLTNHQPLVERNSKWQTRSFPKASSNITKHLKEMEDAMNDLEEQTPKAVAYERCATAIMLIPEMLGEKSDGMIRVYDVSFKTI